MSRVVLITALLAVMGGHVAAMNSREIVRDIDSAPSVDQDLAARKESELSVGAEPSVIRWGVQLAGGFSEAQALASYARVRARYPEIIGDNPPVVINAPLGHRGPGSFYRVRIPAASRDAARGLCDKIHSAGGVCVVLPMGW